jgi:hypothetical protein
VDPVIRDLRRFLLASFSTAPQTLAEFGLEPPKARKPRTGAENAAAAAKAEATRKARGTVGSKKKLTIKGNVTGVLVTPVTEPATPSPSPQPASTASSAPLVPTGGSATK